jgi:hypothetical protein
MGMLKSQRFVAVVRFRKKDNGAYEAGISSPLAQNYLYKTFLPGTSSVSGSLRIPRFHFRRGASFSCPCVDVAVESTALWSAACGLRQGVKLTMPSAQEKDSFDRKDRDDRETARSILHVAACTRYQASGD